jgi:hypothetical protein
MGTPEARTLHEWPGEPENDVVPLIESDEPRDQPYEFAHRAVRSVAFRHPGRFDELAISGQLSGALTELWNDIGDHLPATERVPAGEIRISRYRVHRRSVVVVRPPAPLHKSEAHFIAAVIHRGRLERYFVLEHSWDSEDDSPCTWMGEWALDGRHISFGRGPAGDDEAAFVEVVQARLRRSRPAME